MSTQGSGLTHLCFINNGAALGAANYDTASVFIVKLNSTGAGQFTPHSVLIPSWLRTASQPTKFTLAPCGNSIQIWVLTHSVHRLSFSFQVVQFEDEMLVPDLDSDMVWRLSQEGNTWSIKGSDDQALGSVPQHLVVPRNFN